MGCEPGIFSGRPCDWPGCAVSTNPSVSFAHLSSRIVEREEGGCGQGDWDGCASRLLRGRDRGGRDGPLGWQDRDERRRRLSCLRPVLLGPMSSPWRSRATRGRSRGSLSRTWRVWWWSVRMTRGSAGRGRRPIGWMPARWPSCWPPVSWMRCGCPMSGRARCAGGWRGATSSCARARARRTRSTPC